MRAASQGRWPWPCCFCCWRSTPCWTWSWSASAALSPGPCRCATPVWALPACAFRTWSSVIPTAGPSCRYPGARWPCIRGAWSGSGAGYRLWGIWNWRSPSSGSRSQPKGSSTWPGSSRPIARGRAPFWATAQGPCGFAKATCSLRIGVVLDSCTRCAIGRANWPCGGARLPESISSGCRSRTNPLWSPFRGASIRIGPGLTWS